MNLVSVVATIIVQTVLFEPRSSPNVKFNYSFSFVFPITIALENFRSVDFTNCVMSDNSEET